MCVLGFAFATPADQNPVRLLHHQIENAPTCLQLDYALAAVELMLTAVVTLDKTILCINSTAARA